MLISVVLTVIVLICLGLYLRYIVNPMPVSEPWAKYGLIALGGIVAIVVIANIWGSHLPT